MVYCGRDASHQGQHGPYQSWYANGHVAMEAVFEDGRMTTFRQNDRWGRTTALLETEGQVQRTWWHENGTRAITGTLLRGNIPDGVWSEWDPSGTLVGQVTFTDGEPGPLEGTARTVLFAGDASSWLQSSGDGPDLPMTTSTVQPPIAVNLVATPERLLIDGVAVVMLEDGVVPESDLRGQLISPVYDSLVEKYPIAQEMAGDAFQGEILIQADRALPWSLMRQVGYTAGQAQFGRVMFVGQVASVQWPPRSGPAWQQGAHPLAVVASEVPPIPERPPADPLEPPPRLMMAIHATALAVGMMDSEEAPMLVPCLGDCNDGGPDIEALHEVLHSIKATHEQSTEVFLALHPDTRMDTLIAVLDAAHSDGEVSLFPSFVLTGPYSQDWR